MTLEEAILMALEYEKKVRDAYVQAAEKASDKVGQKVFETLGKEEQGHIDYLESKLREWQETGHVTPEQLETIVPSQKVIEEGISRLREPLDKPDLGSERQMLSQALELETETGNFYRQMVDELGDEGALFSRFLEIEDGHRVSSTSGKGD